MSKVHKILVMTAVLSFFDINLASADFHTAEQNYAQFKQFLSNRYNFDYNLDYSLMWQRTAPAGKNNAVQSYLYPAFTWTNFDNKYGSGSLNFSYDSIYYGGHDANDIAGNSKMVTPINDFSQESQEFSQLYYAYQFPDKFNWLTVGLGQYTLYSFDGGPYNSNQQVNFINYSLSQNATATYANAGLGAYAQASYKQFSLTAGMQDASNIEATGIRFNRFHDKHYTSFSALTYSPNIVGLGQGQYSVMVYNQPGVKEQPQSTTGWSVNLSQFINEKNK